MAIELEQMIKIILGVLVVVAVVMGLFFFFKNNIIDFFKGFSFGDSNEVYLALLK